jgi:hypothetical protein
MRIFFVVTMVLFGLLSPCQADEKSGPGRTTLQTFDGGTIYMVNGQVTKLKSEPGETNLKTAGGKVVVRTTPWGYDIVGPSGTIKFSASLNELKIEEGKKKYEVASEFGGKTIFSFPNQKIAFQQDGFNLTIVSGSKGTLKVEDSMNELKLTSPVGTTLFSGQHNSAPSQGPPLIRHPYTYRAFLLERNGVGIMLNLLPYQHDTLKPLLDWSRVQFI